MEEEIILKKEEKEVTNGCPDWGLFHGGQFNFF